MDNGNKKRGRPPKAKDYNSPLAKRLRELCEGRTQQEIADGAGITRQNLGKFLSGETKPDVDTLEKLATFFKVSTDYLLGRTNVKPVDPSLDATVEYIGLSEKAIENIKQINYSDCTYCIPAYDQTESPLPMCIDELDLLDDITCKYKKDFLNYLFECNAIAPMLSQALRHAIKKKEIIEFHGDNRVSKHKNDYEDYCLMSNIKNFLSHYAIEFSNETDIYSKYIFAENRMSIDDI